MESYLKELKEQMGGQLYVDDLSKTIYATDASVYRELPMAVACPKNIRDLKQLIVYAKTHNTTLIPRTAGTSLAGQCVGNGIVVDVSKHFTTILAIDAAKKTVTVQPGVIRDDLNRVLEAYGLFFGPNTSTSNRCMLGGMVGNNSSGSTSIKYGVTRDKIRSMNVLLSDGEEVTFSELSAEQFRLKMRLGTLEGNIYRSVYEILSKESNQECIQENFPKPEIHRRNTGYALDVLLDNSVLGSSDKLFNMCKLLAGSEGTLAFTTSMTLQLDVLPPKEGVLVALHFRSIENCLKAVAPMMQHNLYSCEMMDKVILDCTKDNLMYAPLRSFVQDDPKAILLCELRSDSTTNLEADTQQLLAAIIETGLSYANVLLKGNDIAKALELRKAGLGLLGNMVGDKKAVACIEDTAVAISDLSHYIEKFTALMKGHNQEVVYYAHAGAGELHLRPILNLKNGKDVRLFRQITADVAKLVKSYKGSMSGEHGDGRLRAEFIEYMVGKECYQMMKDVKSTFDPNNLFNAGKIIDAPSMTTALRYKPNRNEPDINTFLNFEDSQGILRLAEKCNGSGDCRKPVQAGGTMCPSYRATKDEKDSTRGRANALREYLTNSSERNKFNHKELKEVFDLCISCKGCKSECPSNVDVATLKAEFDYQYQKVNGFSLRNKAFAYNNRLNNWAIRIPKLANYLFNKNWSSCIAKKFLGIAQERPLPNVSTKSLRYLINKGLIKNSVNPKQKVFLFIDEFTDTLESHIGKDAIELLNGLGYHIVVKQHPESGRAFISKGFLKQAKHVANKNISIFASVVSEETPLIGIEPSAILSFRDEYLRLADNTEKAKALAKNCFTIEEFLASEISKKRITSEDFHLAENHIKIHVHCHQKALSNQKHTFDVLNLPKNYKVSIIASGCCGMAGSFGYEKEHYDLSMQIGEQSLFPAVRKASETTIIAASGTSCRHQIKDGTLKTALHPISILKNALNTGVAYR